MAPQKYPLEALRKLRDGQAETQSQQLAEQIARSQAAEARLLECEGARRAHAQHTAEVVQLERERLAQGQVLGSDLLRSTEFELAARAQADRLERVEAEARRLLSETRQREQALREELSRREADAKLVRNHEAGFHERAADAAQRAEEETALEQWNARRR